MTSGKRNLEAASRNRLALLALAIAAVGALIVIEVAALVRGDEFYMFLGAALCVLCAAVKFVSMWALGRRM